MIARFAVMLAFGLACSTVLAQGYPNHPIIAVVPYPPGGGTDLVARNVTQKMGELLGKPIVIENRAGAGGNIGTEYVAKAAPDGYTLLVATGSTAINNVLSKNLPWDLARDFVPIVLLVVNQSVLITRADLPVSSVADVIAAAKAKPGKLTFASSGIGSSAQLWGELFKMQTGVDLLHVPYKGTSPALSDVLGGRVDLMFCDIAAALPYIKAGKVKALGVGSLKRFDGLPDVPTISEAGVPGYEASSFVGLVAPAGTPRDIIDRLNAAAVKALSVPELRDQLIGMAGIPIGDSPAVFDKHIRDALDKWAKVGRTADIHLE